MIRPDGTVIRNGADHTDETQRHENGRAESWQAGPSTTRVSMIHYTRESYKATDRRRTDLRTTDRHASWREVYAQCHIEVGMDE